MIAASTNEKRDVFANDTEARGGESSLGWVGRFRVLSSRRNAFVGSVLGSSYPPVPLLLSAFSTAGCWIVTKCWLVIKSCACLFPAADSIFEVEAASYVKIQKMCVSRKIRCSSNLFYLIIMLYLPFSQLAPVNPRRHLQRKPFAVYPA